jgi:two-component system, chemotaxis family, chemotaxis protein CheV
MTAAGPSKLMDSIDARTQLAGSNKMEILLFSLGTRETFGINVFKVKEVCRTPPVTRTPYMPHGVEGVISLRGSIIPVIHLGKFIGIEAAHGEVAANMMVTEFSKRRLGFLVQEVDRIIRVDWERVREPEAVLAGNDGLITALTELDDGKLVSILDVEQILARAFGEPLVDEMPAIEDKLEHNVFFVDDSVIARKKIVEVLDRLNVKHRHANNGGEAWNRLQHLAAQAQAGGHRLSEQIDLIMVDAEMPEMDGYVLTRHIKDDARFAGIPVVMHSSLSTDANMAMGRNVGVDAYVAKFDATVLAETLRPLLQRGNPAPAR